MKLYYDIESGERFDPPIEIPDIYLPQLKDKDGKSLGKIMIFGTMRDDSSNFKQLKEMFYNPKSYNLKEYGEHRKF